MERKTWGQASPPARDTPLLRCHPTGGRGPLPVRHLFDLPRGRGPSQTPKFLSPGPPSPWLPALLIGEEIPVGFDGEPQVQPRGCKGRSPLHEITLVSPFPAGEGGRGDRGQKNKLKVRVGRRAQERQAPRQGVWFATPAPVPPGFSPGDARGEAPCMK